MNTKEPELPLQQIKDSLPKYIEILSFDVARKVERKRRRIFIPDEVLDNQAFWVLWNKFLGSWYGEGEDYGEPKVMHSGTKVFLDYDDNSKQDLERVETLGGEQNIIKHLSLGDRYSVWLGEQLT